MFFTHFGKGEAVNEFCLWAMFEQQYYLSGEYSPILQFFRQFSSKNSMFLKILSFKIVPKFWKHKNW
jgi:hypothetical protein